MKPVYVAASQQAGDRSRPPFSRLTLIRILVTLTVGLGINYIFWRWMFTLNWGQWWISIPLVVAESYSLIDVFLFGMTMWMSVIRPAPPAAPAGRTVDIFIATYDEPYELVMRTARAARDVTYPHSTWILDDGARAGMAKIAAHLGVGYLARGSEWVNRPRHAKAGNINNALMHTDGEFVLILDADQIPRPQILDDTLGYFVDERIALCQTPQVFSNVAPGDPLGSRADLFYGPIQQGKDGWNAAYFCGSNAILRREALLQLGIADYVKSVESNLGSALVGAQEAVKAFRLHYKTRDPRVAQALREVGKALAAARRHLAVGRLPLAEITFDLHHRIDLAGQLIVADDFAAINDVIGQLHQLPDDQDAAPPNRYDPSAYLAESAIRVFSSRQLSPLVALESVHAALRLVEIDRPDEAQPVMPLATISVTEDMATSMRLHGLGWRSVYHNTLLADGLAPEDAGTMLTQRLRWGQGTMQVFFRENPLSQRGMTFAQRLMYFATMWSYLSGFAAVVYFSAPIIFLMFGILPVAVSGWEFCARFLPFMVVNQLLFLFAARGIPTWRSQRFSLALFPVWIRACTSALESVLFRTPLNFAVTPKTRQESAGPQWHLIRPQIAVAVALVIAMAVGLVHLFAGGADPVLTWLNLGWAVYNLVVLGVLIGAMTFTGYEPPSPERIQ